MNWANFFTSRHTLFLERELTDIKARHDKELVRYREENQSLRDELERTRMLLSPALQSVTLHPEPEPRRDPNAPPEFGGSPFQRMQARAAWEIAQRLKMDEAQRKRDLESGKIAPEGAN